MKDRDVEVVFETLRPSEVAVVKTLLESAGIRYAIRGEDRFDAFPEAFRGTVFTRRGRPVTFLVASADAEDARALLASPAEESETDDGN